MNPRTGLMGELATGEAILVEVMEGRGKAQGLELAPWVHGR